MTMTMQRLTAILLAFMAYPAGAEPKRHFDIPAQPLSTALQTFAKQSGTPILYTEASATGKHSAGLSGNYSNNEAVSRLVSGSGLVHTVAADGTVTLKPSVAREVSVESGDTTLPKVTVEADSTYDPEYYADPYNQDYVLPNATSGTKTDTPIMETPLSIQTISKQILKDQQVIRLDQALKNVSGVTTRQDLFGNGFFLRGFETTTLFRNGFRMDQNGWDDAQQFANVESIEVLKGSAATLYGRTEPGGMINIITKQPLAKAYYSLNQQFGSYDKYRTSIDATGPLTKDDTLLYRINASFQSNNSFRDLVSDENVFFAPVIRWNISPKTQATLEMEYQRHVTNFDVAALPFNQITNRVFDNISHGLNFGERNPQETENIFVGLNWSHQFNDDWSLKHQVSYKSNDVNQGYGLIPFSIDLAKRTVNRVAFRGDFPDETVATNLDLIGHFMTWGMKHTLLLGGDYYRFESTDGAANSFPNLSPINIDNPVHPSPGPALAGNNNPTTQGVDNYGIYLQDQIKLPYNVEVMGGFRYQYVRTTSDSGFGPGGGISVQAIDDAATPRVGLSWQPQSWLSLYGNYTENFGAQAGARQFNAGTTGAPLPPQSAQQWEFGAKTEFFDGRLRTSFAYYDLTKQNVATTDTKHITECNGPCSIAAGEVNSHGPEFDIQGELMPGWNVIATYANQDVHITKSTDTIATNNAFLKGQRLQFVPRNVGSFWTTYEPQQDLLKGFKIGGGVNLQDSVVDGTNSIKSPGFVLVGLMASYSIDVGKTKITTQLNVDNLLDKSYYKNASAFGDGAALLNFSTPRTFMGSINVQY